MQITDIPDISNLRDISKLDTLFEGSVMSEPLLTLKDNTEALLFFIGDSKSNIRDRRAKTEELLAQFRTIENKVKFSLNTLLELKVQTEEQLKDRRSSQSPESNRRGEEFDSGLSNLLDMFDLIVKKTTDTMNVQQECNACCSLTSRILDVYHRQSTFLMPMSFVYLVTIWEAFLQDTVRKILLKHHELIPNLEDTPKIPKSEFWNMKSIADVHTNLIEQEIRELDSRKLATYFNRWGIKWEQSGVSKATIIEIRARRDIWVHNRGVVDRQYTEMVHKKSSIKHGQVAKITKKYFDNSSSSLIRLAAYVHKIAQENYYAKQVS